MPDSSPTQPEIVDGEIVESTAVESAAVPATPAPPPAPDYDERGTPSFDYVRDKIEGRLGTSLGSAELAGETAQGRSVVEQEAERAKKAKEKLDEIRRSMG